MVQTPLPGLKYPWVTVDTSPNLKVERLLAWMTRNLGSHPGLFFLLKNIKHLCGHWQISSSPRLLLFSFVNKQLWLGDLGHVFQLQYSDFTCCMLWVGGLYYHLRVDMEFEMAFSVPWSHFSAQCQQAPSFPSQFSYNYPFMYSFSTCLCSTLVLCWTHVVFDTAPSTGSSK